MERRRLRPVHTGSATSTSYGQKMVQKDDEITLLFIYKEPTRIVSNAVHKVRKKGLALMSMEIVSELSKISRENNFVVDICSIMLPNQEKLEITPYIEDARELQNHLESMKEVFDAEYTELQILVHLQVPQQNTITQFYNTNNEINYEDDLQLGTSASPTSDGESFSTTTAQYTDKDENFDELCKFGLREEKHKRDRSKLQHDNPVKNFSYTDVGNSKTEKRILYNNEESLEPTYVGLVNQAMTCYLNSLLQALYMTPEFRNALYKWEYKSSDESSEAKSIPYQLQNLFLNLQTSNKSAVETTSLTRSFGWDSNDAWHQHDIQELCRVMFDALETKFKKTEQADLINRLYEGKIIDYVKCLSCNTEKTREDTFLDIPLPVRPFGTNAAYESVEEALEAFVKYETLEGNNQYFCEKCDKKSDAHKGFKFKKFPYILTLQLKRFDFDQHMYHRIKLNDKVTFPDILNLNSFIKPTSTQDSSGQEGDVNTSIKQGDSFTTDSSTVDEDCTQSGVVMSNSNHLINNDQDDDEGIEMSNGLSSSSCSMYNNHNTEKLREEYARAKGPYIYDLFSIMIHSGSASGGHYYAYIKDFRTNKWLCFNDQIVTPITQEEIQKTYGGGTRGYGGGAYRSSTNAYMLMYRQIDPERNALPMRTEEFPPHIKELLKKIKKNEEDRIDEQQGRMKKAVHYRNPVSNNVEQVTVFVSLNNTLAEIAEAAYKKSNLEHIVGLDQCRIVSYYPQYDLIASTYDDQKERKLVSILDKTSIKELYLDIRHSDNFEEYPSDPIRTKVYVIDTRDKDIQLPKYVRAYVKQTIKEYKNELTKYFDIDPSHIILKSECILPDKTLPDDYEFSGTLSGNYTYRVCVTDDHANMSVFNEMSKLVENLVTFYIDATVITEEKLKELNIPSLSEYYKDERIQENTSNLCSGPTEEQTTLNTSYSTDKRKNNQIAKLIASDSFESTPPILRQRVICKFAEKEEWNIQETSNSEDSSLSDSDRTLVGDAHENSESEDCPQEMAKLLDEMRLTKHNKDDDVSDKFFKAQYLQKEKLWKVCMDKKSTEEELKEKLEQYFHVPKDYFRILMNYLADDSTRDSYRSSNILKLPEDQKYTVYLGRILYPHERRVGIYLLDMLSEPEPLRLLFTVVLAREIQVEVAKKQILTELKRSNMLELKGDEKWCFMDYMGEELTDDDDLPLLTEGICIQKLPDGFSEDTQSLFYVRRWNRSDMLLGNPEEIVVDNDNADEQFKEKLSAISNIPFQNLEFSRQNIKKYLVLEEVECGLHGFGWKPQINLKEENSKLYILYRNIEETPKFLTEEEKNKQNKRIVFRYRQRNHGDLMSPPMSSSPRREKALKIHVDTT